MRDFLVKPLTGCDMLLGNPWFESHHPLLDSKAATFFMTEGVSPPTAIICDRRLPGIPFISSVQARGAIKKGADGPLLSDRVPPPRNSIMSLASIGSSSSSPPAVPSSLEPRMHTLVDKYTHRRLQDSFPPQFLPSRLENHHIHLIPRIVDTFEQLDGTQYYRLINLMSRYYRVRVFVVDIWKMAFWTALRQRT